jgi:uroporphyrinogen decarboxylase
MTHRERVAAALAHQEPDRCPMQVSFTPEFAARLRSALHLGEDRHHNPHGGGNTYELERALGEDMLLTSVGWANSYYANDSYGGAEAYTDEWGITWRNSAYTTRFGSGFYTETVGHPLAEDSAISSYTPPNPLRPALYDESAWVLETFKREYWIVGVTVCTIFETAWALRGYEAMLMDFHADPDRAAAVLDIPFRYHLAAAEKLTRMGVDMVWIGDDVGGQNAMLISPEVWRRFLKPRMARFISAIKGINPALKVAYHSDGCIYPIIPDLIEVGVDVLNPVQPKSMDPVLLKKEYGERLCFWGSIDEQETLPFGTPEDVRAEVLSRLSTLGKGGGLIIGPTHHVQLDTPLENVRALVDTVLSTPYSSS